VICRRQHEELINRLGRAEMWIHEHGLNRLDLSASSGGLGIVACGAAAPYLPEALGISGLSAEDVSVLRVTSTVPFPRREVERLLGACSTVLVLEELEPFIERDLIVLAREVGFDGRVVGKLDGTLPRIGEYTLPIILKGLETASSRPLAHESSSAIDEADAGGVSPAPRPITICAGCPHRGTYLAIDAAIDAAGLDRDNVMVTGDIGCTILGMNPPFDLLWNEVSMGSSLGIAQGYVHAGSKMPVIATIGDSTFFHGGMPGLVNAIQHRVPLTLVILDNGWTAMTGMQINPGTDESQQPGSRRVDLEDVVRGLGPDRVTVVDPYDLEATTAAIAACLKKPSGVGVVISRRECAIQASRRRVDYGTVTVNAEACILCRQCLRITGCPALSLGDKTIVIDPELCNGCGLCVSFCPTGALVKEAA